MLVSSKLVWSEALDSAKTTGCFVTVIKVTGGELIHEKKSCQSITGMTAILSVKTVKTITRSTTKFGQT